MTILVTGAAGFIGSHTCDLLLATGHSVVGVDDFRTGKRENLALAQTNRAFRLVTLDVADADAFGACVREARPEVIIHLAALVSVPESVAQPALNFRQNVTATQSVIEATRAHGVRRIVFASSGAVYGDNPELPLTELSEPMPISPYGGAKLASEALLRGTAAPFGITVRCQRYFNVFGPRQDPKSPYSGVISIFADKLRAGEPPTIFGDGEQTRDFIAVADVARANHLAATIPGLASGVANICTGKPTSLNQLYAVLSRQYPRAPAAHHGAARAGDIRHSLGSPARAQNELGFEARVSLEEGLAALRA